MYLPHLFLSHAIITFTLLIFLWCTIIEQQAHRKYIQFCFHILKCPLLFEIFLYSRSVTYLHFAWSSITLCFIMSLTN